MNKKAITIHKRVLFHRGGDCVIVRASNSLPTCAVFLRAHVRVRSFRVINDNAFHCVRVQLFIQASKVHHSSMWFLSELWSTRIRSAGQTVVVSVNAISAGGWLAGGRCSG